MWSGGGGRGGLGCRLRLGGASAFGYFFSWGLG